MNSQSESFEPEVFSLPQILQSVFDFEKLIRQKNDALNLPNNSPIEAAGLAAIAMLETFRSTVPADLMHDNRIEWCKAVALGDMLRKVMRAKNHPSFEQLWKHVLLLLDNTNIALNVWNPSVDQDANKVFELYMALVLAPLCTDLELEDPKRSGGGKNPDVIALLNDVRWAFACKVMHTDSAETFLQNVRKGVDQIQKSNAQKGIVVISLKNQLPHDEFWLSERPQTSLADLLAPGAVDAAVVALKLEQFCKSYHQRVITELLSGASAFNEIFRDTKAVPAVLLHLCTTVLVPNDGKPNFRLMRMFGSLNADPLPPDLEQTLISLNYSLHGRVSTTPQHLPNTQPLAQ